MLASSSTDVRRPRGVAGASLKGAGLIKTSVDSDTSMRDAPSVKMTLRSAKAGISKVSNRKIGHRQRNVDLNKSATENTRMVNISSDLLTLIFLSR